MTNVAHVLWEHLKRSRLLFFAAVWMSITMVMASFGFLIAPYDPNRTFPGKATVPPCLQFPFGTDYIGRDVLSQIICGSSTSLLIAFGAVLVELLIALPLGLLSGYFGGRIDQVLMRITDAILTIPTIVLLIVAVTLLRVESILSIILVMGFINWGWLARTTRGETLRIRGEDYILATKSLGFGDLYIIGRHILPNIISPIIVISTFDVAWFILYEATVSFIGLGNPTVPSWGRLLYIGRGFLTAGPWVSAFPGIFILLTVLSFNILGDFLSNLLAVKR
mgnify:CR=1 FL=1